MDGKACGSPGRRRLVTALYWPARVVPSSRTRKTESVAAIRWCARSHRIALQRIVKRPEQVLRVIAIIATVVVVVIALLSHTHSRCRRR